MNAKHGQTVRKIPIAPGIVPEVLIRLRRDALDDRLVWRLGEHGACEITAPRELPASTNDAVLALASGRLFAPDGHGSCTITIAVQAFDSTSCELMLDAIDSRGVWFDDEPAAFTALRRAALRELAEDLRFHAGRASATAHAA